MLGSVAPLGWKSEDTPPSRAPERARVNQRRCCRWRRSPKRPWWVTLTPRVPVTNSAAGALGGGGEGAAASPHGFQKDGPPRPSAERPGLRGNQVARNSSHAGQQVPGPGIREPCWRGWRSGPAAEGTSSPAGSWHLNTRPTCMIGGSSTNGSCWDAASQLHHPQTPLTFRKKKLSQRGVISGDFLS